MINDNHGIYFVTILQLWKKNTFLKLYEKEYMYFHLRKYNVLVPIRYDVIASHITYIWFGNDSENLLMLDFFF